MLKKFQKQKFLLSWIMKIIQQVEAIIILIITRYRQYYRSKTKKCKKRQNICQKNNWKGKSPKSFRISEALRPVATPVKIEILQYPTQGEGLKNVIIKSIASEVAHTTCTNTCWQHILKSIYLDSENCLSSYWIKQILQEV